MGSTHLLDGAVSLLQDPDAARPSSPAIFFFSCSSSSRRFRKGPARLAGGFFRRFPGLLTLSLPVVVPRPQGHVHRRRPGRFHSRRISRTEENAGRRRRPPTGTFDIGESVVSPFLWSKGIKKIDYLVLTHAHPDHLNGLVAVARNFRIGEFWEASQPAGRRRYAELKKALGEVPAGASSRVSRAGKETSGSRSFSLPRFQPSGAPPITTGRWS